MVQEGADIPDLSQALIFPGGQDGPDARLFPVKRRESDRQGRRPYFDQMGDVVLRPGGAFWMISVSAATISGATAGMVFLYPCQVIAETVLQKPSTLAAVGQDTRRRPLSWAQKRAMSCMVPPPSASPSIALLKKSVYRLSLLFGAPMASANSASSSTQALMSAVEAVKNVPKGLF